MGGGGARRLAAEGGRAEAGKRSNVASGAVFRKACGRPAAPGARLLQLKMGQCTPKRKARPGRG
jgi:hypothetical protein